jgi:GTPase
MPTYDQLLNGLPPETRKMIQIAWQHLPDSDRTNLQTLLKEIPVEKGPMAILLATVGKELKTATGNKSRVVIVGPANVGKSTLYNHFAAARNEKAMVGPLPGTTRVNQHGDAGIFSIIDTPGADAVGEVGEIERKYALEAASQADILIILFDAVQGIKRTEQELFLELRSLTKPYIVVLNKIDLVKNESVQVVNLAAASLGLQADQVIPINALKGDNISRVVLALASAEPEIVAALGSAMPSYRWQLAWSAMVPAAAASAAIALIPLPFMDFIPLVIVQATMVMSIARIYSFKITLSRARELLATFGIGFLGRALFQELSKLGGIPGWVLSAAVASSTTVAMGYAATQWFGKGQKMSGGSLKVVAETITRYLINALTTLGKNAPTRKSLEESITRALEKLPVGKDIDLVQSGQVEGEGTQGSQVPPQK